MLTWLLTCHLYVSMLSVVYIITMENYTFSCSASLDFCCPPADFFSDSFSRQTGEAKNSPQGMPSYVGRTLCSKYSGYTGIIREAEGE